MSQFIGSMKYTRCIIGLTIYKYNCPCACHILFCFLSANWLIPMMLSYFWHNRLTIFLLSMQHFCFLLLLQQQWITITTIKLIWHPHTSPFHVWLQQKNPTHQSIPSVWQFWFLGRLPIIWTWKSNEIYECFIWIPMFRKCQACVWYDYITKYISI